MFYQAATNESVKMDLLERTNMTTDEFTKLYDPAQELSLGYRIAEINKLISTTYSCSSPDFCSSKELTLKQWAESTITLN